MNNPLILIVEDDFLNRRQIKKQLQEKAYQVLESKNVNEALEIIQKESVELCILDINLGKNEKDGISLGELLTETYQIPFIYLTAFDQESYVEKALKTMPYSYLTKPFKNIDLITSVELALKQSAHQEKYKAKLLVKENDFKINLPIADIYFLESDANYVIIYTEKNNYRYRTTIKEILNQLPLSSFVQVHRAFVVNRHKIEKISSKSIIVAGHTIPIAKGYKI